MSAILEAFGDLEEGLKGRSDEERLAILHAITSLFLGSARQLSDTTIGIFDEVLIRLVSHIEARALTELSERLAPEAAAPAGIIRRLASDDAIEVAWPVLQFSGRLSTDDLVAIASTKGQKHLAAIAGRARVQEPVSDVLVERGDTRVAIVVTGNSGARFSPEAFSRLAARAEAEEGIAELIAGRPEISPEQLATLVRRATATIRLRLSTLVPPLDREKLDRVLTDIAAELDSAGAHLSRRDYAAAQAFADSLPDDPPQIRATLCEFAQSGAVEHSIALLARLGAMPIPAIERILVNGDHGGSFLLLRALEFDWSGACTVLSLRPHLGRPRFVRSEAHARQFRSLATGTARKVLHFWQTRANGEGAGPDRSRPGAAAP